MSHSNKSYSSPITSYQSNPSPNQLSLFYQSPNRNFVSHLASLSRQAGSELQQDSIGNQQQNSVWLSSAKLYVHRELFHYYTTSTKKTNQMLVKKVIEQDLMGCTSLKEIYDKLLSMENQIIKSTRLSKKLSYMKFQLMNINFLMEIGDSEIIATNPGLGILLSGPPSAKDRFKMLCNLPNPYNNPAVSDSTLYFQNEQFLNNINFNDLSIIYVTGATYNPYGHSILRLGDQGYIHINERNGFPQFIPDDKHFAAYLRAQGGRVVGKHPLPIRCPEAAKTMLKKLALQDWSWKIAHNNCLTFIHKIAFAGGVSPRELGYQTIDIHTEPKHPLVFNENRQKVCVPTQMLMQHGSVKAARLDFSFLNLFEDVDPNKRDEIAAYHAMQLNNGLQKKDALEFVQSAYNLKLHTLGLINGLQSLPTKIIRNAIQISHSLQALPTAALTRLMGDKRPAQQQMLNTRPALTPTPVYIFPIDDVVEKNYSYKPR